MATNDFIQDVLDKMTEDSVEYVVIAVQKGKQENKSNAYFNITTVEGADMIITTFEEIYKSLDDDGSTGSIGTDDDDDLLDDPAG